MSELDLGIFAEFWGDHPNHLPFLGFNEGSDESEEWNLTKSLERLDHICDNSSEKLIVEGIKKLLVSMNWRPHLVAIFASFKISKSEQEMLVPDFWKRLENVSWVSPQILSFLSIVDNEFEAKGKEILKNGFVINYSPNIEVQSDTSAFKRESLEKVLNSIKELLGNDESDWRQGLLQLIDSGRLKRSES